MSDRRAEQVDDTLMADGDHTDTVDVNYTMSHTHTATLGYAASQQTAYLQHATPQTTHALDTLTNNKWLGKHECQRNPRRRHSILPWQSGRLSTENWINWLMTASCKIVKLQKTKKWRIFDKTFAAIRKTWKQKAKVRTDIKNWKLRYRESSRSK